MGAITPLPENKTIIQFLSKRKTELCVRCFEDTGIDFRVPVELRNFYVEGIGQLCFACARKFGLIPKPLSIALTIMAVS